MFIMYGNWTRILPLDTILIILLFYKLFKNKKSILIAKIIFIVMIVINFIWELVINMIYEYNITLVYVYLSYFFALITLGLLVMQINPLNFYIKNPKLEVYITLSFNLVLLIATNRLLYDGTMYQNEMYIQLIFVLLIISIQGILSFYNVNMISYFYTVISFILLLLYNIINSIEVILVIILAVGIIINIVFAILKLLGKKKEIIQIE